MQLQPLRSGTSYLSHRRTGQQVQVPRNTWAVARPDFKAAGTARDDFFTLSPLNAMDQQMAAMNREMAAITQDLDRQIDSMLDSSMGMERQALRDWDRRLDEAVESSRAGRSTRALDDSWSSQPNVQFKRSEQSSSSSYSYYQSITISNGSSYSYSYPQAVQASGTVTSPLLIAVTVGAALYAVLAAWLAKNIKYTKYKDEAGWRLGLSWPLLVVTNKDFRHQFWCALQGKPWIAPASGTGGPGGAAAGRDGGDKRGGDVSAH